jgi:hypothetical protein
MRSRQELWFPLSLKTIADLYPFSFVFPFREYKPQQTDVGRASLHAFEAAQASD